jgi:hypothetical protein
MPRRKLPGSVARDMAWQECVKKGKNPIEELLKLASMKQKVPSGTDPDLLKAMIGRYDLVEENGELYLVTTTNQKISIYQNIAEFVVPKMKSSENINIEDKTIRIILETNFDGKTEVIDMTPENKQIT